MTPAVTFYYDLGDPECWLVAERIATALPLVPEFVCVLARGLGDEQRQPEGEQRQPDREALAGRAAELGLLPLRWPRAWPPDSRAAALAATYAAGIGKVVAFSLAAFRQTFAAGRDLGDIDTVLLAGAACEMHPRALLKAIERRSVALGLQQAIDRARGAGISRLPAIAVAQRLFVGESCPERAALALAGAGETGR